MESTARRITIPLLEKYDFDVKRIEGQPVAAVSPPR
jgi:hypothetical protein